MTSFTSLQKEIDAIKARNMRVERDKTWETSWTRRIFIAISTYILIALVLYVIGVDKPLITAIIPAVAYLISTLSLSILKDWWIKKNT